MEEFKTYMLERFKEKSTYVGLSAFFASLKYQYTDAMIDDAASFFILLCGLAMVFTKDDKKID